jgi:prevent-host-death family protein
MQKSFDETEATARFSELVDRAKTGESLIILRNGAPVAELRPFKTPTVEETVARIRALGHRIAKRNAGKPSWPLDGKSWREVAHEGHKR